MPFSEDLLEASPWEEDELPFGSGAKYPLHAHEWDIFPPDLGSVILDICLLIRMPLVQVVQNAEEESPWDV